MSDVSIKYYELLGVAPGASAQELKTAHRDLAKVWHPDRFAHDPRLQQKAQEKLKEINEAYDHLVSGKTGRRAAATATASRTASPRRRGAERANWKLLLPVGLALSLLLFAVSRSIIPSSPPGAEGAATTSETSGQRGTPPGDEGQPSGPVRSSANDSTRGKRAADQPPQKEAGADATAIAREDVRQTRAPLPTVTVTIDPASGMLATPACPNKSRMTYPLGSEPSGYCNLPHQSKPVEQEDRPRAKESRLKSLARRLSAPVRSFGSKEGSEADNRRDAKATTGGDVPNR